MLPHPASHALAQTLAAFLNREDFGLWAQVPHFPDCFLVEVGAGEFVQIWHGNKETAHKVGPPQPCELALEEGMPELVYLCYLHRSNCPWVAVVESSD